MATSGSSAEAFWAWVRDYVCQPHPAIGREGPVCPFLPTVIEAGGLELQVEDTLDGTDAVAMAARMRDAIPVFEAMPRKPWEKAMVVLFAAVPEERAAVVDDVQAALKPDCVRRGLMAGQFHAGSGEPAARNPDFRPNRAPFAAIALRHMSHHDIVFLDRSAEMFREYDARYGEKMAGRDGIDPFLVERYEAAAERFGAG